MFGQCQKLEKCGKLGNLSNNDDVMIMAERGELLEYSKRWREVGGGKSSRQNIFHSQ